MRKLPRARGSPTEMEVCMLENTLCVYRCSGEVFVCVICSFSENELIMGALLEGVYGALCSVT